MRQAVYNIASGDSVLGDLLAGGLYDANDFTFISRSLTPQAFDENSEVKPCCLMRVTSANPNGPYTHGMSQTVEFFVYQRSGYDIAEQVRERLYELLHDSKPKPVGPAVGIWAIFHAGEVTHGYDDEVRGSVEIIRFTALVNRRSGGL